MTVSSTTVPQTSAVDTALPRSWPLISVVLPCLNEEGSVGEVIRRARDAFTTLGVEGEVVVADNGSTDGSRTEAAEAGARVVDEPRRGYGYAYHRGIASARGEWIVMADADGTYDLSSEALARLLAPLAEGAELVMGDRFAGGMSEAAMPWSHRYIGNPILSGVLRILYGTRVRDAHCGIRAFTRPAYDRLGLRTSGMEYASEMVMRAAQARLRVAEVPVSYRDRVGESKLRTLPDGWRHLCLMLLYSPTHLFIHPGAALFLAGLVVQLVLFRGPLTVGPFFIDYHSMFAGSLACLVGVQALCLGFTARVYAATEGIGTSERWLNWFITSITVQRAMLAGLLLVGLGGALNLGIVAVWASHGFSNLDALRPALLALTLTVAGVNVGFAALFVSALLIPRLR